jgi:hypothetical protein
VLQFRVYFSDGITQIVEAPSGEQARRIAGQLAKDNGVFVKKIKVNKTSA